MNKQLRDDFVVYAGLHDSCMDQEDSRQLAEIREAVVHPNFTQNPDSLVRKGMAILDLLYTVPY